MIHRNRFLAFGRSALACACFLSPAAGREGDLSGEAPTIVPVEAQPLAANAVRILEALEFLGNPFPAEEAARLEEARTRLDAAGIQRALDARVLAQVAVDRGGAIQARRGPGAAKLQQAGFTAFLLKILNPGGREGTLRVSSPQAGPVYAGVAELSMRRQDQERLNENPNVRGDPGRFLYAEIFDGQPMKTPLGGLEVEYAILLLYSSAAGRQAAELRFAAGSPSSSSSPGPTGPAEGAVALDLDIRPAVRVRLSIADEGGRPAAARLTFRDAAGHVFPPQHKRLAPDLFFQEQIYRRHGDAVLLPPGKLRLQSTRGPEYRTRLQDVEIPNAPEAAVQVRLERWIDPMEHGFYSGDHHIHGAGCAHYSSPTQGIAPQDMFLQVQGEGLNVGCILTWGPCFDFQRRYFSPAADRLSEDFTVVKYDLEISGFGSQALGHVCLLNLRDQVYPGSEGSKDKGWPTWTTPVMRWARGQGAVAGYAHSASGLQVDAAAAARRLLERWDASKDGGLTAGESAAALLPEPFAAIDKNGDGRLAGDELTGSLDRAAERLPNLAVPEMDGVGAMEIAVSAALGACDFISAMDTPRIAEWNCWYHLLDCGLPVKVSGETDFPCMSGTRVGQGRVYVQLGKIDRLDFAAWCEALRRGRSYVSDGFAHAVKFTVNGAAPGFEDVRLESAGEVAVEVRAAFAPETPLAPAHGTSAPPDGKRWVGDTVTLHGKRSGATASGGSRLVEIVVNGRAAASREVPADGRVHALEFRLRIERSSWVALRQFPQLHTNPVNVLVGGKPIRASADSARWCGETIRQLWKGRERAIAAGEREAARAAFDEAAAIYERFAAEAAADGR